MIKVKPWEMLEHKVYYSKDDERLYTSYELYIMFEDYRDDEALKDYHGDFLSWLENAEIFDELRPIVAVTVLWVTPEDGGADIPLLIDGWASVEDAEKDVESWGWFYDDGFSCGSLPMSVVNLDECERDFLEWITDSASEYSASCWDSLLYGDVPYDVLTIK